MKNMLADELRNLAEKQSDRFDCELLDRGAAAIEKKDKALADLIGWFKGPDAPAMIGSDLLLAGCPNDLKASLAKARGALVLGGIS